MPRSYSSKTELKSLAMKYAKSRRMDDTTIGEFLLEVDRIKSTKNLSDGEIIILASRKVATSFNF
jgi:hypothetical protein